MKWTKYFQLCHIFTVSYFLHLCTVKFVNLLWHFVSWQERSFPLQGYFDFMFSSFSKIYFLTFKYLILLEFRNEVWIKLFKYGYLVPSTSCIEQSQTSHWFEMLSLSNINKIRGLFLHLISILIPVPDGFTKTSYLVLSRLAS